MVMTWNQSELSLADKFFPPQTQKVKTTETIPQDLLRCDFLLPRCRQRCLYETAAVVLHSTCSAVVTLFLSRSLEPMFLLPRLVKPQQLQRSQITGKAAAATLFLSTWHQLDPVSCAPGFNRWKEALVSEQEENQVLQSSLKSVWYSNKLKFYG